LEENQERTHSYTSCLTVGGWGEPVEPQTEEKNKSSFVFN